MKYKEVSVLRNEIEEGEMRKERKWTKTVPDDKWDQRNREGNERRREKVIK